jgi:hypothetical protein
VPVLGTQDVVGAPKFHGWWKRYLKKDTMSFSVISQAYLEKF